eukprot:Hpha_TRINITY_DN12034_c0_g1::TRINITY_DN12034_c0_g1_i1::g.141019::m.141019
MATVSRRSPKGIMGWAIGDFTDTATAPAAAAAAPPSSATPSLTVSRSNSGLDSEPDLSWAEGDAQGLNRSVETRQRFNQQAMLSVTFLTCVSSLFFCLALGIACMLGERRERGVEPLHPSQILMLQSLVQGLFMCTVVALPMAVGNLQDRAADKRFREWSQRAARQSRVMMGEEASACSHDTFESRELRGLIIEEGMAWADVDEESTISGKVAARRARGVNGRVRFNPKIDFNPPKLPPCPQPRSCLKPCTRPSALAVTAAALVAVSEGVIAAGHEPRFWARSSFPRVVLLLVAYGGTMSISVGGQYSALLRGVGLCDLAVLMMLAPAMDVAVRWCTSGLPRQGFSLPHVPTALLATAGVAIAVSSSAPGGLALAVLAAVFFAISQRLLMSILHEDLHMVAPCGASIAVGALLGAVYSLLFDTGLPSPAEGQIGLLILLGVFALASDCSSVAASFAMSSTRGGQSGVSALGSAGGRAFSIVFALGLQSLMLDQPPAFNSSLAAVCGFSAGLIGDLCNLGGNELPYERLAPESGDSGLVAAQDNTSVAVSESVSQPDPWSGRAQEV